MSGFTVRLYDYIINVNFHEFTNHIMEDCIHRSLVSGTSIFKKKTLNAVLCTSSSARKIFLYPEWPDKISCLDAASTSKSAIGIGYSSFGVATFGSLKSIQTLNFPFFLRTGKILDNPSTYQAVRMNLACKRRSISSFTLFYKPPVPFFLVAAFLA